MILSRPAYSDPWGDLPADPPAPQWKMDGPGVRISSQHRDDPQHEGPSAEDAVAASGLRYQSTGCCGGGTKSITAAGAHVARGVLADWPPGGRGWAAGRGCWQGESEALQ